MREPWEVEAGLEDLSGEPPRSIAQVLALSVLEPSEALRNLSRLEDYAARYLHQSWAAIRELTWAELLEKFENTVDMVRAENGRPPRGEFDPGQRWQ